MKLYTRKDKRPFRLSYGGRKTEGRSLMFTPFGTRFVVVTLAVGVAAVNSGSNLLYLVVSMMLSMVVLSGVLSEQTLRRIKVSRALPPEIYAKNPFPVRYNLTNGRKRVPSFALSVSEYYPDGGRGQGAFLLTLPAGKEGHTSTSQEVPIRGRWAISGFEVATRFPFGLFVKSILLPYGETRTVYPRIRPLPPEILEAISGRSGEMPTPRKGHGIDVRNLREYLPYDEARIIHWKSSARSMRLLAKEFEAQETDAVTVIIDNMMPEGSSADFPPRFEEAVSLAASAIHHAMMGLGRPASLVTRISQTGPVSGRTAFTGLMETLATLETVPPPDMTRGINLDELTGSGPSVLVLPGPDSGWAVYRGLASLTLEPGGGESK